MATLDECRQALEDLAAKLAVDDGGRRPPALDRSLSCRLTDLDTGFRAHLTGGVLHDVVPGEDPSAQVRLTVSSDDLVALARGQLHFARAWATGRLSVHASVRDLLRIRSML